MDAILPRLTRVQATIVVILISPASPWAAVTLVGFWRTRGRFGQTDPQVFNERRTGGRYWYAHGWNPTH